MPLLVTSAEGLWESLLAGFQRQEDILFRSSVKVKGLLHLPECFVANCVYVCKSLDAFNKHLSDKEHTKEENRIDTHSQSAKR
ncbi:hypothetical protein HID58_078123 [Brassica napus]|uniref:C2H2-type domain-containing protein n=1 Tax=Brassica napus TaxID=3708 RepID=A0ABQ7YSD7_BRANA|nr:hypothetical protein HID58_078123 [Brassica napus]